MNQLLRVFLIGCISLQLVGCQPKKEVVEPDLPKEIQPEIAAEPIEIQPPMQLESKIERAIYHLPHCEKPNCATIDIDQYQSNQDWLNQRINNQTQAYLQRVLDQVKIEDKDKPLQSFVDFAHELQQTAGQKISQNIHLLAKIDPISTTSNLYTVQFKIDYFFGGAHDEQAIFYKIYDLAKQQDLSLDHIINSDAESKLEDLVKAAYIDWIKAQKLPITVEQYQSLWPFRMSHNAWFDQKGLNIQYQTYQIAPHQYKSPVLKVSYAQLEDTIKPDYLDRLTKSLP